MTTRPAEQPMLSKPVFPLLSKPLIPRWLAWAAAFLPCALMLLAIARYGVDLARMDEIGMIPYWAMWHDHHLTLAALMGQANESRPLFPRLIILGFGALTHWNTKVEMYFTQALVLLNLLLLVRMARRMARPQSRIIHPFFVFLAALALFSPWQAEFLWGFQMLVHIPITCIIIGITLCHTRLRTTVLTALLLALAFISTYSFANGLLAWPALGAYLIYMRGSTWRRRIVLALVFAVALVLTVWLYFHQFIHPEMPPFLVLSRKFLPTFLAFLGAPLGALRIDGLGFVMSALWGGFLLLMVLGLLMAACAHRALRQTLPTFMPFLVIISYVVASGLIATGGRLAYGSINVWAATRYAGFSTYLIAAVILMVPLAWHPRLLAKLQFPMLAAPILIAACGSMLVSQGWQYLIWYGNYPTLYADVRQAKTSSLLIDQVDIPEVYQTYFPWGVANLRVYLATARRIGLYPPALSPTQFQTPATSAMPVGSVDQRRWNGSELILSGWAALPSRRPADAVIFTASVDQAPKILKVAFPDMLRPDLRVPIKLADVRAGWTAHVPCPPAVSQVRVWALDAPARRVYPITTVAVPTRPATLP